MALRLAKDMVLCDIYKSNALADAYLYVDQKDGLSRVPAELLERFNNPELVTRIKLTPERKLARAQAESVMKSIFDRGYYLQMPPPKESYMTEIAARNDKLPR